MKKLIGGGLAALAIGLTGCTSVTHLVESESYKQGYSRIHDLPAFTDKDRAENEAAAKGGLTGTSMCAMLAPFQSPLPSDSGDWVRGCADALRERGVA